MNIARQLDYDGDREEIEVFFFSFVWFLRNRGTILSILLLLLFYLLKENGYYRNIKIKNKKNDIFDIF